MDYQRSISYLITLYIVIFYTVVSDLHATIRRTKCYFLNLVLTHVIVAAILIISVCILSNKSILLRKNEFSRI